MSYKGGPACKPGLFLLFAGSRTTAKLYAKYNTHISIVKNSPHPLADGALSFLRFEIDLYPPRLRDPIVNSIRT